MHLLTIAQLTIKETQRRRIMWVALIMGALFLLVFGIGLHYIFLELQAAGLPARELEIPANALTLAGLYVTNFLVVIMSVLISVASISQEIDTHVIDTLVTKPLRRVEIVLGKWLGFAILSTLYTFLLAGGVILITFFRTGYKMENEWVGLSLMSLNALVMLTLSIAGGTRLSTLANGVVAFMLYGIAFIGGWVETIGSVFRNDAAVNIGIIASLLNPIEAIWRKASVSFQPQILGNPNTAGPFAVMSEPSDIMIGYALAYIVILMIYAVWSFRIRDL